MKRVKLHIESLALKGFRHEDRHEIAAGLEAELGRALRRSGGARPPDGAKAMSTAARRWAGWPSRPAASRARSAGRRRKASGHKAAAGGGSHEPACHGAAARDGIAASGGDAAAKMRRQLPLRCLCQEGRGQARTDSAPPIVRQVLNGAGQPLDTATRGAMEQRFGHDFGRVRIHADGKADASARAVGASAYAVGPHIVFARGQYAPATKAGEMLLAHELTHVLQQPATRARARSVSARRAMPMSARPIPSRRK